MSNHAAVGLIGLGQMGLPICRRLTALGDVIAFDISVERRELASADRRVRATDRVEDVAACDRIILSLPTPAISRSVAEQLSRLVGAGTVVVETSTVLPSDVRALALALEPCGAVVIDAAVLSGVAQMENGNATLLVGGEDAEIERASDILDVLGPAGVRKFGPLGSGMAAKVVNNGVAHSVMVVLAEAFAMARSQGLDLLTIVDMLSQSDGGLIRPLTHRVRERVARSDYEGGMPLDAARKDSTLALAMAEENGIPLFATQAAHTVYELGLAAGLARKDYSAIASLWEQWTGESLGFAEEP